MPLFEVAILEKVKTKKGEKPKEKLVFGPKATIASDAQAAALKTVMDEGLKLDMDNAEVLVRAFAWSPFSTASCAA